MTARHLHNPTALLICWVLIVLAVQILAAPMLPLAAAAFLFSGRSALGRWWRLAWRTRWLVLSLLLVISLSVPGEPLFAVFPSGPSREGVVEALIQSARLMLALAAVAILLDVLRLPALMAGCHGLLRPIDRLGLSSDRAVARLALTLHYAEALPRPRDWRALLRPAGRDDAADSAHHVKLPRYPVTAMDAAAVLLALLLLAASFMTAAGTA